MCLCNALTSAIGLGQSGAGRRDEPSIVTLGSDLDGALALLRVHTGGWTAAEVVDYLRAPAASPTG